MSLLVARRAHDKVLLAASKDWESEHEPLCEIWGRLADGIFIDAGSLENKMAFAIAMDHSLVPDFILDQFCNDLYSLEGHWTAQHYFLEIAHTLCEHLQEYCLDQLWGELLLAGYCHAQGRVRVAYVKYMGSANFQVTEVLTGDGWYFAGDMSAEAEAWASQHPHVSANRLISDMAAFYDIQQRLGTCVQIGGFMGNRFIRFRHSEEQDLQLYPGQLQSGCVLIQESSNGFMPAYQELRMPMDCCWPAMEKCSLCTGRTQIPLLNISHYGKVQPILERLKRFLRRNGFNDFI